MSRLKIVQLVWFVLTVASIFLNLWLGCMAYRQYCCSQWLALYPSGITDSGDQSVVLSKAPSRPIVFFGDSRIAQWNPMPGLADREIINRGIPGITTSQALLALDSNCLAFQPSVVVLQIGINDLKTIGVFPDSSDAIYSQCQTNLSLMIDRCVQRGIKVVVLTIIPPGSVELLRRPVWSAKINEAVRRMNNHIRQQEREGIIVVDCDEILATDNQLKPEYQIDTLHMNDRGYRALNPIIESILRKTVSSEK
jgi:lysophospholipase L1-like esterase